MAASRGLPGGKKELPLSVLLTELSECLVAASGDEASNTSQQSDTDAVASRMQTVLLALVSNCTKTQKRESHLLSTAMQSSGHAVTQEPDCRMKLKPEAYSLPAQNSQYFQPLQALAKDSQSGNLHLYHAAFCTAPTYA